MFKKIGRFLKNTVIGAVKGLPIINLIGEIKDLKLKKVSETLKNKNVMGSVSDPKIKESIYQLLDIIDDGKLNESVNQKRFDKIVQLIFSALTSGITFYVLFQSL